MLGQALLSDLVVSSAAKFYVLAFRYGSVPLRRRFGELGAQRAQFGEYLIALYPILRRVERGLDVRLPLWRQPAHLNASPRSNGSMSQVSRSRGSGSGSPLHFAHHIR